MKLISCRILGMAAVLIFGSGLPAAEEGAPAKLVITNARLFTLVSEQREPFAGYLVVAADGTLAAVGAGEAPPGLAARETWDAGGQWILPGFISAHSHLWQSAYRGLASDQTLMGWVQAVYLQNASKAVSEDFYWFTLHGALDHLRHGITGAYNFNYSSTPERFADVAGHQFRAECDAGIRFVHGTNVGAFGPKWSLAQGRAQTETLLASIKAQPPAPGFLGVMINGAAAFVATPEQARGEAALMRELGLGNHTHFLESPPDQYQERAKFQWFLEAGLLGKGLFFGHFVHADPWILRESVKAGVGMSWNPLSNGRLASGTPDIPAYLKAGLRIGMGVDGQASADLADPFENMRAGLYQVRARYQDASVLSPYDVVRLHTRGSAEVLGVGERVGTLEAGKLADFIVIDPADFGPVFDPYASLVFMGTTRDLARVYVGGEMKFRDGALVGVDFPKIREEVRQRVQRATGR